MEGNDGVYRERSYLAIIYLVIIAICLQLQPCESDAAVHNYEVEKQFKSSTNFIETNTPLDLSNSDPYDSSPLYFPPPYDSLPPSTLPEDAPPYCINPPFTPQTPPTESYTPPPPLSVIPTPPSNFPSPIPPIYIFRPPFNFPSPTQPVFSPPLYYPSPIQPVLSPPPYFEPNPPNSVPSPIFLPPIVYPPPSVPPPPYVEPFTPLWCVAKASVPDPIIQEAMNYACGSGADCGAIQSGASCFEPDTLFAHASYAFNSYWQRTKVAGGTCDFGGTAVLVTVDPSYDGCHFIFY